MKLTVSLQQTTETGAGKRARKGAGASHLLMFSLLPLSLSLSLFLLYRPAADFERSKERSVSAVREAGLRFWQPARSNF